MMTSENTMLTAMIFTVTQYIIASMYPEVHCRCICIWVGFLFDMKSSVHIDFTANILIGIRFFGTPLRKIVTDQIIISLQYYTIDFVSSRIREAEASYNVRDVGNT
jgi:hypothetical protein